MMYVEFMKNFFSPIQASFWLLDSFRPPEPQNVWYQVFTHVLRRVREKFSSRGLERADGCYTHFGLLSAKTFDSHFLENMYVWYMKNFLLANSSELLALRLISAFWAPKRLIPSFYPRSPSSSWKIFFSPIRASWSLLDSFRRPEHKYVSFLLFRHDVRRVHEKFSSFRFEAADGCKTHFGLLSPKTFDSYFLDMMYVEFMKNFLLLNSSDLLAFGLISASWAQKR